MHAAPSYIAETAPPSVRGLLISLKEAFIVGGILLGYVAGFLGAQQVGGWRPELGAAAPLAVALGMGMLVLPESPRWLVLAGRPRSEAEEALKRARGRALDDQAAAAEVSEIVAASPAASSSGSSSTGAPLSGVTSLVSDRRYLRPLYVGMSLMLFQQITGQPSVLYFATPILQESGFTSIQDATASSVAIGLAKLVMTGAAVATVDRVGRRPLLLGGVGGIVGALVLLSLASSGSLAEDVAPTASLLALLLYVGSYQLSFGPISWLIVGEASATRYWDGRLGVGSSESH